MTDGTLELAEKWTEYNRRKQREKYQRKGLKVWPMDCAVCGQPFIGRRPNAQYCSADCAKDKADRRLRENGSYAPRLTWHTYWAEGIRHCDQCEVELTKPTGTNQPNEVTLDHIVPRSRGGQHTRINTRLLCRRCNSEKTDKINDNSQLALLPH